MNQTEDTSGTGGPKCGGKHPETGRISFDNGAMETSNLVKGQDMFQVLLIESSQLSEVHLRIVLVQQSTRRVWIQTLEAFRPDQVQTHGSRVLVLCRFYALVVSQEKDRLPKSQRDQI